MFGYTGIKMYICNINNDKKQRQMNLLEIASKNQMTVTELKSLIVSKVNQAVSLGFSRQEAEQIVKKALFDTIKGN